MKSAYEEHHKLTITDEALEAAAHLSARYVPDRFLPDKAIDLIDESSSRVRMYKSPEARKFKQAVSELRTLRSEHQLAVEEDRLEDAQELVNRQAEVEATIEQMRAGWHSASSPRVVDSDIDEKV